MLKIITSLSLALITLAAQSQVKEQRALGDFNKISISDGIRVLYSEAESPSATIETSSPEGLPCILTEIKNNTLIITAKNGTQGTVSVLGNNVSAIKAEKGAEFTAVSAISSKSISIDLSTGAKFNGNASADMINLESRSGAIYNIRVDAGVLRGNFKSDSKANVSGIAMVADISTGKGALCHARNLLSGKVRIDAGEQSTVRIASQNQISVDMAESAKVIYFGNPGTVRLPENVSARIRKGEKILTEN